MPEVEPVTSAVFALEIDVHEVSPSLVTEISGATRREAQSPAMCDRCPIKKKAALEAPLFIKTETQE